MAAATPLSGQVRASGSGTACPAVRSVGVRVCCALVLGVALALLVLTTATSEAAAEDPVAGRVFTLAALPDTSRLLAVEPSGAVWGDGWTLRPGDLRPRRLTTRRGVLDLAALRRGGVIFSQARATGGVVWRRTADGTTRIVAGRATADPTASPGTDGGRATEAALCGVGPVAASPDGGFVFVDGGRVRRVAADGTISTRYVLPGASAAYGCREDEGDPSEFIGDLAVVRDGSLILATGPDTDPSYRLVRIAPTGERRLLLVSRDGIRSIAAAPDGSVLYAGDMPASIRRLNVQTGRSASVLPSAETLEELGRAPSVFDLDGVLARSFFDRQFVGVAVAPDGGIVTTSNPLGGYVAREPRLHYGAPERPTRLAVAMEPPGGSTTTRGYATRLRITRAASLSVRVSTARGGIAYRAEHRVPRGRSLLRLRHRFRAGLYDVRITVRAGDARAQDAVRAYLGGTLPVPVARRALVPASVDSCDAYRAGAADEDPCFGRPLAVRDDGCRSYRSTRVDCRYSYRISGSSPRQCFHVAGVLRRNGTVEVFELETPRSPIPSCAARRLPPRPEWIPRDEEPSTVLPEQP